MPRRLAPTGPGWALELVGVAEAENGSLPVINVSWSVQADGNDEDDSNASEFIESNFLVHKIFKATQLKQK